MNNHIFLRRGPWIDSIYIVKGWFSFHSWGGGWLTGTLNLSGLKPTFQVEKVSTAVKRYKVFIVKGCVSFHSWVGGGGIPY